jgi:hypothetical protein
MLEAVNYKEKRLLLLVATAELAEVLQYILQEKVPILQLYI